MSMMRSSNNGSSATASTSREHVVQQGECINSIAAQYGLFWETIWNDSANSELRRERKNPDLLLPGDRLVIPEIRVKRESGATEKRHRFRRKGVPIELVIRVLKDRTNLGAVRNSAENNADDRYDDAPEQIEQPPPREPEANQPYELRIDDRTFEGSTDGDGILKEKIPPDARRGRLVLRPGMEDERVLDLLLGYMDPVSEPSGAAKRLANLGYRCTPAPEMNDDIAAAIKAFQEDYGIEPTGRLDQQTRDKLQSVHGS